MPIEVSTALQARLYKSFRDHGGVAERSKAPVLKTGDVNSVLGFESLPLRHDIVVKPCYLTFF